MRRGRKMVFTNGCFDLIHRGHVEYLAAARSLGDLLIVGLNSDGSVRRLKGPARPLVPLADRAAVLSALSAVDVVVPFSEDTPYRLIRSIQPDVLVKGADYRLDQVVGADIVQAHGGRVLLANIVPGHSTTTTIGRVGRVGSRS